MFHAWMLCVFIAMLAMGDGKRNVFKHPSSQGEVWPKPWMQRNTGNVYNVVLDRIKFKVTAKKCSKIKQAIQRCKEYIATLNRITDSYQRYEKKITRQRRYKELKELQINVLEKCEDYPHFQMDERYKLVVAAKSVLNSTSVWGMIRGMETFSQLFYVSTDYKRILIKGTGIVDKPNYLHRGLMLDTGRHYLSVNNILKNLDAMAMNKMNVFHWHIVDDNSFPYHSMKLPELSKAAFHPSMVYSQKDLIKIRDYASDLGIRVLMEFDMPAHFHGLAVTHPEIITKCAEKGIFTAPLNPIKNKTYAILKDLLSEVQELFPDAFFHLGGDEVNTSLYYDDPEIKQYMKENHLKAKGVHALFFKNVISLLKPGTIPVVWQDVFDAKVPMPKETVIQTWRVENGLDMEIVLRAGYRVIQSAPFYLNVLEHEMSWFYKYDPRLTIKNTLSNDNLLGNVIGGTACMWGEMVDDTNVLSRVWPRAAVIAEVFWSETQGVEPDEATLRRIEEQTCRMIRRGIPAEPASGPGFCLT